MGIRVKNGSASGVAATLEKIADRSTRQLRRVHVQAANAARDTAEQMAPFKTGELEGSIKVTNHRSGGRKVFTIRAVAPHATLMHEGVYNLGPGSRAKQATVNFVVGRKYLSRAVQWLIDEWRLEEKAAAAVKSKK